MRSIVMFGSAMLSALAASPVMAGDAMFAVTPSGRTEAVFHSASSSEASGKLVSRCMANGLTVVTSQPNEVVCELKMGVLKSALMQSLVGNSYSTPPKNLIRFTIAGIGANAVVQANEWVETQMAFGQVRRQDLVNDSVHNDLINFMLQAGAAMMPGTSFPNHAYLGVQFGGAGNVRFNGGQTVGITIASSEAEGPLNKAGVQPGDVLVAINGKTFKTIAELQQRLKGIPVGHDMNVTVLRGEVPTTLKAIGARRPDIPMENLAASTPAAASQPAPAPQIASVADELAKLATLRDKGVLTEAEFQAQKASLLKH